MKKIIVLALFALLSSCNSKNYKDLRIGVDSSAEIEAIMGKPDAIETGTEVESAQQIWHYYDVALDLYLRNDTLDAITETSGMEALGPKGAEVLEH